MSPRVVTGYASRAMRTRADRAVLLAHGAGSDLRAAALVAVSEALAREGVPSLRFDFPYRSAGRRAPDRPPVLAAAVREAAAELSRRSSLPPERLVLGGRSMGGRVASLVVADPGEPLPALGLALLGYPLHAPGRPDAPRTEHFAGLRVPVLFASGTRDTFGSPAELRAAARRVRGPVSWHWVESGDHGFKPLRSSGIGTDEALAGVARAVVEFVRALPVA